MSCGCEYTSSCSATEGRLAEVWGRRTVAPVCEAEVAPQLGPWSLLHSLEFTGSYDFVFLSCKAASSLTVACL